MHHRCIELNFGWSITSSISHHSTIVEIKTSTILSNQRTSSAQRYEKKKTKNSGKNNSIYSNIH